MANDVGVAVDARTRSSGPRQGLRRSTSSVLVGNRASSSSMVVDDERWLGRGAASEIGHLRREARRGEGCECGGEGCLEAYAGRGAMERDARRKVAKETKTNLST